METYNRPHQRDREGKVLKDIAKTRLYGVWHGMHDRCYNPNNKEYHNYGAKGIAVCEAWHLDNVNGFYNFREWSLANGYREDLSIDRIDGNENYEPQNCRWTTKNEQNRNTSRNHPITVNGVQYNTIIEACEALNMEENYKIIRTRITRYGWTAERALTEPIEHGQGQYNTKQITVDGKEYKSIKEACKALGRTKDYSTIKNRLHQGLTADEAFRAIAHHKTKRV